MKRCLLSWIVAISFVATAAAEEPKLPKSAMTPTVVLASAKETDGKVSLRIRTFESVPTAETRTVTTYQSIVRVVDGKQVTEKVPVQSTISVMIMKPVRWRETTVKLGDAGVEVRDLAGKEVPAKKLAELLQKETAVLLSSAGEVDPFHLQLAKEGTLLVIAPPMASIPMGGVGGRPVAIPVPAVGVPAALPAAPPVPVVPPPKAVPDKK